MSLRSKSVVLPLIVTSSLIVSACDSSDSNGASPQNANASQSDQLAANPAGLIPVAKPPAVDTGTPVGNSQTPATLPTGEAPVVPAADATPNLPQAEPATGNPIQAPVTDPAPVIDTPVEPEPIAQPVVEPPAVVVVDTPAIDPEPNAPEENSAPQMDSDPFDAPEDDNVDDFVFDNPGSDPVEDSQAAEADSQDEVSQPPAENNELANQAPTSGIDLSGGNDDSPTRAETLSLQGPFITDPTRAAGPPSVPTDLTLLLASDNWVEFSWAPSADDQSIAGYEVFRDGQLIGTVRGDTGYEFDYRRWLSTSFTDCNYTRYTNCASLQPQTGASYAYSVAAIDGEGMRSAQSTPVVLSMATPGQGAPDLSAYRLVFDEEFDGNEIDRGRWKTSLPWGPNVIVNSELQYFVNPFGPDNVAYDPFVLTGDTLQITGINTPADQLAAANGQPFLSGVLSSNDYFEMTYGYVEMRAKLASGKGMLSTFFLFNQDFEKNKPEIDIIEYQGAIPDIAYQTHHYYDSNRARYSSGERHSSPTMEHSANQDLSNDFRKYSVLWEPGLVIWYIDGVETRRLKGPRISDEPMNIVTQLVMGSEWIGTPDQASVPAVLEIDYIKAWQK